MTEAVRNVYDFESAVGWIVNTKEIARILRSRG
jgi:hypothetical protein